MSCEESLENRIRYHLCFATYMHITASKKYFMSIKGTFYDMTYLGCYVVAKLKNKNRIRHHVGRLWLKMFDGISIPNFNKTIPLQISLVGLTTVNN